MRHPIRLQGRNIHELQTGRAIYGYDVSPPSTETDKCVTGSGVGEIEYPIDNLNVSKGHPPRLSRSIQLKPSEVILITSSAFYVQSRHVPSLNMRRT